MKWLFNRSLKRTILWLFIPMILVFTPVTGIVAYLLASQQLRANAETGIHDTLAQTGNFINDRLTAMLTDVTALDSSSEMRSLFYRADQKEFALKPQDYVSLSKSLDKVYSDFYTVIDSVFVYYNKGRISIYRQDYLKTDFPFDEQAFLRYPYSTSAQMYWLNLHDNELEPGKGSKVASLFKWVGGAGEDRTGIILLQLKEDFFRNLLTAPKISSNGYLLLASPDGFVSFKSAPGRYEVDEQALRQELLSRDSLSGRIDLSSKENKKMVVLYDTIGINKWKLAAVYPQDDIYAKVNAIQYVTLSVMGIVFLLAVWLSSRLAHFITRPITKLTRQIGSIEQGHLELSGVAAPPGSEIGILHKGIQEMLDRIKRLLTQVEYEQEQKRLLELSVLQTQIQPHFLYNTLYSIRQLCEMGENDEASRMITALSNYFRISISKGSEIIPVATELDHVLQYLTIQRMRYGDTFAYETEVSPELLPCPIVKLTLQPLVENAIYHGVKKVRRAGLLRITGYIEQGNGVLQVSDNGKGMSPNELARLQMSLSREETDETAPVGFGVRNVHRRLQLHYGPQYGLTYQSAEGLGTTVTVVFPLQAKEMKGSGG